MNKAETKRKITEIEQELAKLAKQCAAKDVDIRPWISHDHPLSLEHWGLTQQRIRLRQELKKPELTPEQRQHRGEVLRKARLARAK